MQLERIAIATDFSEPAAAAAEWVAHYFAPGAQLRLIHVIDPGDTRRASADPIHTGISVEGEWNRAARRLGDLANAFDAARCSVEVRIGRPADEIVTACREYGADVVVVGKHGRRAGLRGLLGSTAEELVRRSAIPVLLAAEPVRTAPRKLLVAVNDSRVAPWVVQWARFLAERFEADATAVHVIGTVVFSSVLAEGEARDESQLTATPTATAGRAHGADDWLTRLCGRDAERRPLSADVIFGDPAEEIVRAAERMEADAIVMGSRGLGKVGSAVLGSVAGAVLRHAPCPVLVVKEPEDEVARVG